MNTFSYVILFAIVILMVFSIGYSYWLHRKRMQAWRDVAERTGLSFNPGSSIFEKPVISGGFRGFNVVVDTFTRGTGKSRTTYTRIVFNLHAQSNLTLSLSGEGLFSKVGKSFGMQDIETGDAEIDERYVIKGQPEAEVVRLLSSIGLRQKLLTLRGLNVEVKGQQVYYHKRGAEANPDALEALLDVLGDLAQAVERSSERVSLNE
jgi:hypothetical protein